MNTTATTSDTPPVPLAVPDTQHSRTPAEDPDAGCATARAARRPLLDRIGEAVRAAHAASVPF